MSRLIRSLEADRLLFLKPASPSLFGFYERLGFQPLGAIPGGFRMKDGHYEDICPDYPVL